MITQIFDTIKPSQVKQDTIKNGNSVFESCGNNEVSQVGLKYNNVQNTIIKNSKDF